MHALDFSTGKAGMAFIGEVPWHGLGQQLTPGAPLETWQHEAGLEWTCKVAGVKFDREIIDFDGKEKAIPSMSKNHIVLYRSDTGEVLHVPSNKYKPVQPKEVIEFYRDLTEKYGFQIETAGSIKGGKRIWALANTKSEVCLRGGDVVKGYLLLATSYDGSLSTQARFTSIRVVCNNTLGFATANNEGAIIVPHSTTFNADQVKVDLQIGEAWERFSSNAAALTQRIVSKEETTRFLLDVYFDLTTDDQLRAARDDEKQSKSIEKFLGRLTNQLFNSPGSHLASAQGTLWGVLNAVTRDVDFAAPARNQENRLNSAWFGPGHSIKNKAWSKALALVA